MSYNIVGFNAQTGVMNGGNNGSLIGSMIGYQAGSESFNKILEVVQLLMDEQADMKKVIHALTFRIFEQFATLTASFSLYKVVDQATSTLGPFQSIFAGAFLNTAGGWLLSSAISGFGDSI